MNSIGVKGDSSVQNAASGRASRGQPVAEGAVADLVVVLVEDDELLGRRGRRRGAPKRRRRKRRVAAVVHVRAVEGLGQLRRPRRTPRTSPARSPVSSTRSAWWKSSAQTASQPVAALARAGA